MAQTQKIYLGDHLIVKTFQGDFGTITRYTPAPTDIVIQYLIVGGGGPGGFDNAGGGGAGGLISGSTTLINGTYEIIVGDGGHSSGTGSLSGSNSDFLGQTAIGGGAGGTNLNGTIGGSGGGGGYFSVARPGGLGTLGQGNAGATGSAADQRGGGGGGATAVGTTSVGGAGAQWLDGNYYAGGGGGGVNSGRPISTGGIGGGGNGGIKFVTDGQSGSLNTGGGGGGDANGSRGGSGIVIVRYESPAAIMSGGDEVFTSGSYTYHKFLTVGTGSLNF
jgi:hypothetical protein